MREIRFLDSAERGFHDAQRYYENCQTGLGDQFTAAVEQKLFSLRENPD